MAYDLIRGKTLRDWSCGAHPVPVSVSKPSLETSASMDPNELAEITRSEIAKNASAVIRLRRAGHLPETEFVSFRKFHAAWDDYWDFHRHKFRKVDSLNLWNLREVNQQFTGRITTLDKLAKTPIKRPVPPRPENTALAVTPSPVLSSTSSGHPWSFLLGAGVTLGVLAFLGRQDQRKATQKQAMRIAKEIVT